MFYDFQADYTRKYTILRDYYEKTPEYEAIIFIMIDPKTGEIFKKSVLIEDLNARNEWKKIKGNKQASYIKIVVEQGDDNYMIEEIGKVKKKKSSLVSEKELSIPVKQYKYVLKK